MAEPTAIATVADAAPALANETTEKIIKNGDLGGLSWSERYAYFAAVCAATGLDPITRPFDFIVEKKKDGDEKVTLYLNKEGAAQLTEKRGISIVDLDDQLVGGIYRVKVTARLGERTMLNIGAVDVSNKQGESLANAMMKATTKAIRRVTISIAGMGWLDQSEAEDIAGAVRVTVDGETIDNPPAIEQQSEPKPHGGSGARDVTLVDLQKRLKDAGRQLSEKRGQRESDIAVIKAVANDIGIEFDDFSKLRPEQIQKIGVEIRNRLNGSAQVEPPPQPEPEMAPVDERFAF